MLNDLLFAMFAAVFVIGAMPWLARFSFWLASAWIECVEGIRRQYFDGK